VRHSRWSRALFVCRQCAMTRMSARRLHVVVLRASSARCRIVLCVINSSRLESLVLIILVIYMTTDGVADLIKTK
jgi:hypothetical protein